MDFKLTAAAYKSRVEAELETWFERPQVAERLARAMCYSLNAGGKRVRPMLVYASAELCLSEGLSSLPGSVDTAAAAIEAVHTYSLIHDDLPAMDDDDLRRGQATCHRKFDEATAILAGDALLNLAYEKLAAIDDAKLALALIRSLGNAAGALGMVGGQMLDLEAEGLDSRLTLQQLETIHRNKTGALIISAVQLGALCAGATELQQAALNRYAAKLGLAFQVQDDILDVVSDSATLGKDQGSDLENNKSTYVSLLGLESAQALAATLVDEAKAALEVFAPGARFLVELADYVVQRKY
ncbi:polyprenyl synthetase family protein [Agaribacterium haliotis]|uniref:polyprenyl synthetase family protein n=1 Tax=Agaribacterium haliotis TaxID=2013869 RepID=UPI000BB58E42|nr:farnesyl diphosphate synthase [Agaribacterium haliotis]